MANYTYIANKILVRGDGKGLRYPVFVYSINASNLKEAHGKWRAAKRSWPYGVRALMVLLREADTFQVVWKDEDKLTWI